MLTGKYSIMIIIICLVKTKQYEMIEYLVFKLNYWARKASNVIVPYTRENQASVNMKLTVFNAVNSVNFGGHA